MTEPPAFLDRPSPEHPGWNSWALNDPTRFNALLGPILYRVKDGQARIRMTPERQHSNLQDRVHGGAILAFIDVALFAAAHGFGVIVAGTAVTLDLSTQFIGGARVGEPLEARVELLRETGRLLFLRGLVVQGGAEAAETVASFAGTVRKPTRG